MKRIHLFRLIFAPSYFAFMYFIGVDFSSWITQLTVLFPAVGIFVFTLVELIRLRYKRPKAEQK